MRAVQYSRHGGPEVLDVVDLADPVPGEAEVLVEMKAAGVLPADWKLRSGLLQEHMRVVLPKVPGRGGAGIVRSAGRGSGLRPGDRVLVSVEHSRQGTQAELVACPPANLARLPGDYDLHAGAALVRPGVAAWASMIETARVEPGMRVLIHGGAGGIGAMAIQLARNAGATVTATAASSDLDYVSGLGASDVIAYDREDFAARPARYDVVLDTVGGDVHERSHAVLAKGGRLLFLNAAPIARPLGELVKVEALEKPRGILAALAREAAAGRLKASVAAALPIDRVREAYELVERRGNRRGQTVLTM